MKTNDRVLPKKARKSSGSAAGRVLVLEIFIFCLAINILFGNVEVMAKEIEASPAGVGSFSLHWAGGMEYGSRQFSFDGGRRFYFSKGDTINSESQTGVGLFELDLQNSDIAELKSVGKMLCSNDVQKGGPETVDPSAGFSVVCVEGDQVVTRKGSLRLIPEEIQKQIYPVVYKLSERAYAEGRKLIKLDFSISGIEYGNGKYMISVNFINSGNRWIKFKTPDQWPGTTYGGALGASPRKKIGTRIGEEKSSIDWGFPLAGQELLNRGEFHDGIVVLNPGESKILKFTSIPDNRISKGEYEFSGVAFMNITYEGDGWGLSNHVDFRPIKTRITLDRDYPSTPQEREQWEATHRAGMSFYPVNPGEQFAEDGLYRAVRLADNGAYRSLQLMPFKAGDIATQDNVKMLMASASGTELNGLVQWLWEGCAPTPIKPYSPDSIEATRQFCAPGSTCPRTGRWLARIRTDAPYPSTQYRYDLANIVTVRQGTHMPLAAQSTEWEWLGA